MFALQRGKVFLSEVSSAAGRPVVAPDAWREADAVEDNEPGSSLDAPPAAPTVADLHSAAHHAKSVGFDVGVFVAPKKAASGEVFKITVLRDEEVRVAAMLDGKTGEEKVISPTALLEDWRLHKGKITCALPGWSPEEMTGSPSASVAWATDGAKSAICLALRASFKQHEDVLAGLDLLQNPSAVKANKKFSKHHLVLVPASQRIERSKSAASVAPTAFPIGWFDIAGTAALFQVAPHFVAPAAGRDNAKQAWVAPFWLVEGGQGSDANMELVFEEKMVADYAVQVPLLRNSRVIEEGERLVFDKNAKHLPKRHAGASAAAGAKKRARQA